MQFRNPGIAVAKATANMDPNMDSWEREKEMQSNK